MRATRSILASTILCTKLVRALNDWSVPCISGACSYGKVSKTCYLTWSSHLKIHRSAQYARDLFGNTGNRKWCHRLRLSFTSTVLLQWGSAISDITTAAGWEILGCDQNAMEQDIRLVCTSSATACDHLYSSGGAEGKIVRLPESVSHVSWAYGVSSSTSS